MSRTTQIYLDNHSTTPLDPRVLAAMQPYLTSEFGNAASRSHGYGWRAEAAVEMAREQVAQMLGAEPKEIIFTSGATESNNLALQGLIRHHGQNRHIITNAIEHKCILEACKYLQTTGVEISVLPVDEFGLVDPEKVKAALRPNTILVSIMLANNEVGTINPIAAISKIVRDHGAFFHTDAAQAIGRMDVNVNAMGIDLLSLSAHKFYGPKGVGALYLRSRDPKVEITALQFGGGHEQGLRSGTVNVAGVVGLGKAAELVRLEWQEESQKIAKLRDHLWAGLQKNLPGLSQNGHPTKRLANNLSISFPYIEGDSLAANLKAIAVSTTSACLSQQSEISYVLQAMGLPLERQNAAVRFGLGRFTTAEEIEYTINVVTEQVQRLQAASPLYQLQGHKK